MSDPILPANGGVFNFLVQQAKNRPVAAVVVTVVAVGAIALLATQLRSHGQTPNAGVGVGNQEHAIREIRAAQKAKVLTQAEVMDLALKSAQPVVRLGDTIEVSICRDNELRWNTTCDLICQGARVKREGEGSVVESIGTFLANQRQVLCADLNDSSYGIFSELLVRMLTADAMAVTEHHRAVRLKLHQQVTEDAPPPVTIRPGVGSGALPFSITREGDVVTVKAWSPYGLSVRNDEPGLVKHLRGLNCVAFRTTYRIDLTKLTTWAETTPRVGEHGGTRAANQKELESAVGACVSGEIQLTDLYRSREELLQGEGLPQ